MNESYLIVGIGELPRDIVPVSDALGRDWKVHRRPNTIPRHWHRSSKKHHAGLKL